jgi:hypothetical protein
MEIGNVLIKDELINLKNKQKTNSVDFSPQANYIDWAPIFVPNFADIGVTRG